MEYIEIGKEEGRLVAGGKETISKGYFIKPTVFADLDPKATHHARRNFWTSCWSIESEEFR